MHIVLANQWFPPESGWGGVAMWNWAMAHSYQALGHKVTVIASRASPNTPAEHITDGIRVKRLLVRDVYRWGRLPGVGHYIRPMQQLHYAWRVNSALLSLHRQQPIHVVEFAEVNAEGFFLRVDQLPQLLYVVIRRHLCCDGITPILKCGLTRL